MRSHKKNPVSTFGHVSSPHGRDAFCPPTFAQIALSNSELFTFSEIQDGDRRHLGFLVYVNRRTYASDLHLMTSRKLTSGFDFWSRGHLRVALLHLPI